MKYNTNVFEAPFWLSRLTLGLIKACASWRYARTIPCNKVDRYDDANASSTALTIDDEHASSGNSGRTLDGRESAQSCLFTGGCCGLIGIRMTDSSCDPLRLSCDIGLSIAIVVRRRQWLEAME